VVGDREIRVAERLRGPRHLGERALAVRGLRVHVEVAADVAEGEELWQPPFARGLDLAPVLPQLRLDIGKTRRPEDLVLGAASDRILALEDPVLVELQPFVLRERPNRDVVGLRPGEIVKRRPVALRGNHPDVHLQAAPQGHGGTRGPPRQNLLHLLVGDEVIDDRLAVLRRHQDIEVPHSLLAPPQAPRHHDLADAGSRAQMGHEASREILGGRDLEAPLGLPVLSDLVHDLGLEARAEARELANLARRRGREQVLHRVDAERLVQHVHTLWAEPGDARQGRQRRGRPRLDLLERAQVARLDDLLDLASQILPDPGS
jgi:hypothetical protein